MIPFPSAMTASLFDEMDRCADALRASRYDLHFTMADKLRTAFRQLQQARMPELTCDQAADLCNIWMDRYLAARMVESEAMVAVVVEAIDAAGGRNGPPIRCPGCGHIISGPADPFSLLDHGLHVERMER